MKSMRYIDIVKTLPHMMASAPSIKNSPSIADAVEHINCLDLSLIERKLQNSDPLVCHRWTEPEINIGIQYYRNFLFLNKKYLDQFPVIPPMLEVDEIWHHHILDSHQYVADCERIFGHYFHHYPYFGMRGETDQRNLTQAFNITQLLHKHEFGYAMKPIWAW